jgi:phosphopantetheinyl transferase
MTMIMSMMMDVARELTPGLVPIAIESIRAYRWLAVAPPVELVVQAKFDGQSKVEVTLEGYAAGIVEVARAYPSPPEPDPRPLTAERPAPMSARELYDQRWMFHGPAYQGVTDLGVLAQDGIRGRLVSLAAQGGLLDNAGQLLGFWVMQHAEVDRLAMPVIIERISFYGPDPQPGEDVDCLVRILELGATEVRADIELLRYGRVWAKIDGWEDRRFDSDARVWDMLLWPEKNVVAEMMPEGFAVVRPPWRAHASRDLIARRYLREEERAAHNKLGPAAKNEWLLGRIAVKDAVRHWLWARGHGPLFPAELEVHNEPSGKPVVTGPFSQALEVSVAHKQGLAVACVSDRGPVGIDLEKVQPRGPEFESIAFTAAERERLPIGEERDTAIARYWVAKEAAGKARGTGLAGNPAKLEVVDHVGSRLQVRAGADVQPGVAAERPGAHGSVINVETTLVDGHVVGWTIT